MDRYKQPSERVMNVLLKASSKDRDTLETTKEGKNAQYQIAEALEPPFRTELYEHGLHHVPYNDELEYVYKKASMDFSTKYLRDQRWDVVGRGFHVLCEILLKKVEGFKEYAYLVIVPDKECYNIDRVGFVAHIALVKNGREQK